MCIKPFNNNNMLSLILSLLSLLVVSNSMYCDSKYQCLSVSENYNYVDCVNNSCVCNKDFGFTGEASTTSKCDCPSIRQVYWKGVSPYCITYEDAVTYQQEQSRDELLMSNVAFLYTSILWPNAASLVPEIVSGSFNGPYYDLFDDNVVGRIDPLGDLVGKEDLSEYFVGSVCTGYARVVGFRIDRLIVDGDNVYINVELYFARYNGPTGTIPFDPFNLTQTGHFTFNAENKIRVTNLVIRNNGLAVNHLNFNTPELINSTCTVITSYCDATNDPNGYYIDMNDCVTFLNSLEYGTWDNVRSNTVTCRRYHHGLVPLRPHIHCEHVGKTGGDECVLHTSEELYLTRYD